MLQKWLQNDLLSLKQITNRFEDKLCENLQIIL